MDSKQDTERNESISSLLTFGAFALLGLVILLYECFGWLRNGYWTPVQVGDFIAKSATYNWANSRGVEKIFDTFRSVDLGPTVFIVFSLFFMIALNRSTHTD